ncbi:MAG: hypothetical protein ISQ56_07040 [Pseudomonadales bacterium]|nr:hypothetical protein [Pseudomonadales bacterium]
MSSTVNMNRSHRLRFKPIEVLIMVVILGILTIGAIPSFRAYLLSAIVEEAVRFGEDEAIKLNDFYKFHSRLPVDISEANLASFDHINRLLNILWLEDVPARFSDIEADSEHTEEAAKPANKKNIGALSFEIDVTNLGVESESNSAWFLLLAQQGEENGVLTWKCVSAKEPIQGIEDKYLPRRCLE